MEDSQRVTPEDSLPSWFAAQRLMETSATIDFAHVAKLANVPLAQFQATAELLDDGNTVPFITRYRKDQTGGLDEEQIRRIQRELDQQRALADRKQSILKSIDSQGKLTEELAARILATDSSKRLEDLYLPFRPKKETRAAKARQRGLEPLADELEDPATAPTDLESRAAEFVQPDNNLPTTVEVLQGVGHILAERYSERADLRSRLRKIFHRTGKLVCSRAESRKPTPPAPVADGGNASQVDQIVTPAAATDSAAAEPVATTDPAATDSAAAEPAATTDPAATTVVPKAKSSARSAKKPARHVSKREQKRKKLEQAFKDFFEYEEPLSRLPPHRILAINRGERADMLKVKIDVDLSGMIEAAENLLVPADHPHAELLRGFVGEALQRLVCPSLEREARRELTERAEQHAIEVFARNLRNLLLQPPVSGRKIVALDPGFRSGCKLAALDEFGNVLCHDVIHVVGKAERQAPARTRLAELVREHGISVVAIGNGTACRETETFVAQMLAAELADDDVAYVIVNEAGASVYSTSELGREELPDYDATQRSAVSIGRRLLDPLSELVKINPANIGVGLYQHDVKGKHLRTSLDDVVASCVNFVGVDVNSASPALLRYVSGLNQLTARRLFDYRQEHGPFQSREGIKNVPGIGERAFVQAAGFLKIAEGDNPLDATWIHPENYSAAEQMLEKVGDDLNVLNDVDTATLAAELSVGQLTLQDILASLHRPGRDPRSDLPQPTFRRGIIKLEDLQPGMELSGTVLNVVDFGAFVDIGLHDSGLVHISRLADRYVRDPHEVVGVGDIIQTWVVEIDPSRRRVSLTAIKPGTEKPPEERRGKPGRSGNGKSQPKKRGPGTAQRRPKKSQKRSQGPPRTAKKKPSAPVVPITEKMADGKEPMRTFGDLIQFYEKKKE